VKVRFGTDFEKSKALWKAAAAKPDVARAILGGDLRLRCDLQRGQ
jgi:hypothetical protein